MDSLVGLIKSCGIIMQSPSELSLKCRDIELLQTAH
jgi:hypothetical protein